ncbi:hypothetical protein RSAG8_12428, partial [Rhizoctonia solani AG-8 WAC10335]
MICPWFFASLLDRCTINYSTCGVFVPFSIDIVRHVN